MLNNLRLHHIFLLNIAFIFVILVGIMLGVSYYAIKQIDASAQKTHISKSIILANELLKNEDEKTDLNNFVAQIKSISGYRATIIDENGTVIAESDKNKAEMGNHITRPEIMQSMRESIGDSIRHSASVNKDFIYVAIKTNIGEKPVFLRLANEINEHEKLLYSMWFKIAIIFIMALLATILASYGINRRIEGQISNIAKYLAEIERKNFKAVLRPAFAREFFYISSILVALTKKLEKQDNQKKKYTTKLKIKNRQATDIVEAIAHEFKNPVAAVMGYTETIMNDENIDPKIRQKFLEKIYTNGSMISKMIDRLSLSLRLENNSVQVKPEKFKVGSLLEEAGEQLLQKYKKRVINVEYDESVLYADRTLIHLVMLNLIDNALKYSESDVLVKATEQNDGIKIEVIDRGLGIHDKDLDNVMKKFYRVHKNGWDNSLGLGLALVRYILDLHSSNLQITSKLAVGSTFYFIIQDYKKPEQIL